MVIEAEPFLVNTNCFIAPYRNYYAFDILPAYWENLAEKSKSGRIVLLDVVKDELTNGGDELARWVEEQDGFVVCSINDEEILDEYAEVMQYIQESGYYNEKALNRWAQEKVADPWLIAAAKAKGFTLITDEAPSGGINKKSPSGNPKIPDVANAFSVPAHNLYYMMRKLGIRI